MSFKLYLKLDEEFIYPPVIEDLFAHTPSPSPPLLNLILSLRDSTTIKQDREPKQIWHSASYAQRLQGRG